MKYGFFSLVGLVVGLVLGLLVAQYRVASTYFETALEPSTEARAFPLVEQSLSPAAILSGSPTIHGTTFFRAIGGEIRGGFWVCEGPAVINVGFPVDEWVYVIEGRVEVDYLGNQFTLAEGDFALFKAGTRAIWNVPEVLKKAWASQKPDPATRRLSRFF